MDKSRTFPAVKAMLYAIRLPNHVFASRMAHGLVLMLFATVSFAFIASNVCFVYRFRQAELLLIECYTECTTCVLIWLSLRIKKNLKGNTSTILGTEIACFCVSCGVGDCCMREQRRCGYYQIHIF